MISPRTIEDKEETGTRKYTVDEIRSGVIEPSSGPGSSPVVLVKKMAVENSA